MLRTFLCFSLLKTSFLAFSPSLFSSIPSVQLPSPYETGHILFLMQQGEHKSGWDAYHKYQKQIGHHDHELLHQISLKILAEGFHKNDPECQLLSLFGASITAHEEVYSILEESLKSKYPLIQLVALRALAAFQTDKADAALSRALGHPLLEIRYVAVHQLCLKNHPQAVSHAESLMYKVPSAYRPLFPPLLAMVDSPHATKILKRLLNVTNTDIALSIILSAAKYRRDDLLPQLRQTALQIHFALQEACCGFFATMKDEESLPKITKMTLSQYPTVVLSAWVAHYKMGQEDAIQHIEEMAEKGDLFAINALGSLNQGSNLLARLQESPNLNIRLNATLSLLKLSDKRALKNIEELLFRDKRDLGFTKIHSPGQLFVAWKATPSASQIFNEDIKVYLELLELKEEVLKSVRKIDTLEFVTLTTNIFKSRQNELIKIAVSLLEEVENGEALLVLQKGSQQIGHPYVRHLCGLSLMNLGHEGPYTETLKNWLQKENKTELIRIKPFNPWEEGEAYTLKPEEKSQLLIDTFEAFAARQDEEGINVLIDAIEKGHEKNKYALAGLLLRSVQ